MKSSPPSKASTGLCKCTLGKPGMAPSKTSSMLGCVAAVIETESPSQPKPAVIQRICTSLTAGAFCVDRPYGTVAVPIAGFLLSRQKFPIKCETTDAPAARKNFDCNDLIFKSRLESASC